MAGFHVDGINPLAVGRVGVANRQLGGVVFRLANAFGQCFIPSLRFDRGQLRVAIFQNVVSLQCLAPASVAFDATERDRVFATNPASVNNAPTRRSEGGVDVLGSGFSFVHWTLASLYASIYARDSTPVSRYVVRTRPFLNSTVVLTRVATHRWLKNSRLKAIT